MRIYIRGAYGPGNLGDDVLLLCVISIARKHFPNAKIFVGVENSEIAKKLSDDIIPIHYKKPMSVDLVIYGGGGQFFDFGNGNQVSEKGLLNKARLFVKRNKNPFWAIRRLFYSIKTKGVVEKLIKTRHIALYSIGVGPFLEEGKGLNRLKAILKKEGFFSVRDSKSLSIVRSYNKNVILSADPTFTLENWYVQTDSYLYQEHETYDYTFICRYWPYSDEGRELINETLNVMRQKARENFKVRLAFLYKNYDQVMIDENKDIDSLVYDPSKWNPSSFIHYLTSTSKTIISSRAHGIWLPVILGKPVLGLGIENKIFQVNKSLENCTKIIENKNQIEHRIDLFENQYHDLAKNISIDLSHNKKENHNLEFSFKRWIDEKFKN